MAESDPFDVVIVGAGLTGALVASRLADEGLRIALFEATRRVGGTLTRQPVLALLGTPEPLTHTKLRLGEERAHSLWQSTGDNLRRLEELLDRSGVPYSKEGSLRLAKDAEESAAFRESAADLNAYGHAVELEDDSRYGELAAIRTVDDFLFDPAKLISKLLDHENITVALDAEVQQIRHRADGSLAIWAHQHYIWSSKVILANGIHAARIDNRLSASLQATCVHTIVFEGVKNLLHPLIMDSGRIAFLPWGERAYLVGWDDHEVDIVWRLQSIADQLCPDVLVQDRFTTWVADSVDRLPIVGRIPGETAVYAISGLGPFGINLAPTLVDELAQLVLNDRAPVRFALNR
jgi:glycine/D-amino acid oxidase-like deaminating enzyme